MCIRRGAKQIGGTCIEVESQGKRILLDIGQPLDCPDADLAEMPKVSGLEKPDPSLLGIIISHPHLDHYGLAFRVPPSVPFLMGAGAERILAAAAVFTPAGGTFKNVIHLVNGEVINLGPFKITPFLVDHSAYDAYAILVEADGKRLFYTGDLRGHGRKAQLFERLVKHPPQKVDVLLMEGTTITRAGTYQGFPTEAELEMKLMKIFKETKGLPLVWCSGMNIDFLVTAYRAAKRAGRNFIVDMYTAHIMKATGNPKIPHAAKDWDRV
ncbi:MAG: MBL fold metallo-hydrolase, partial [bacterium]